jgi:hypothetical protein
MCTPFSTLNRLMCLSSGFKMRGSVAADSGRSFALPAGKNAEAMVPLAENMPMKRRAGARRAS